MNGKPAHRNERARFPRLKDEIGEDPAKWLDRQLVRPPEPGTTPPKAFVWSLIDGIDSIERCRAWKAVERSLATRDDREPRQAILERLDEREQELREIGERDDRLPDADELQRRRERSETVGSCVEWVDDGEPYERNSVPSSSKMRQRLEERREQKEADDQEESDDVDAEPAPTAVADGGEDDVFGDEFLDELEDGANAGGDEQ